MKNKFLSSMATGFYLLLFCLNAVASSCRAKPDDVIKSFVKAVFTSPSMPAADVAKNFMIFEGKEQPELNRNDMLAYQLNKLREEKMKYYDVNTIRVVPFKELPNDKKIDFRDTDRVYGVYMQDTFIMYVSMKNERVLSFEYIMKGSKAFFIVY